MVCTARFAFPLAWGSFWIDVTSVNEYSFENSSNSVETNFGTLSDLKISGIPCLVNMDCNARIVSLYFWDTSSIDISMRREKYQSFTKRYACPLRLNESVRELAMVFLELQRVSLVRCWVFDAQYICDSK